MKEILKNIQAKITEVQTVKYVDEVITVSEFEIMSALLSLIEKHKLQFVVIEFYLFVICL